MSNHQPIAVRAQARTVRGAAAGVALAFAMTTPARAENPLKACNDAYHAFVAAAAGAKSAAGQACAAKCASVADGQGPQHLRECSAAVAAATPAPRPAASPQPMSERQRLGSACGAGDDGACQRLQALLHPPAASPREPEPVRAGPSYDLRGATMVPFPGGNFRMGSDAGGDEGPRQVVHISAFALGRTEVTNDQYGACVRAGACKAVDYQYCGLADDNNRAALEAGEAPVTCVNWDDARTFAQWAGGRLPSESQWEYAARGGGGNRKYPWGDAEPTCDRAVFDSGNNNGCGRNATWPVCSKPAGNTPQGLCDLAGNAYEWVEDTYHDNYNGLPTDGSAWTDASPRRVVRGGGWFSGAGYLRASVRSWSTPDFRSALRGFRLAGPASPP